MRLLINLIICTSILYFYRNFSVEFGGFCYNIICDFFEIQNNVTDNYKWRLGFEILFHISFFSIIIFIVNLKKDFNDVYILYLITILISPIIYILCNLMIDKTCLKIWINTDKLFWYLSVQLPLIILIYLLIKKQNYKLKKSNLIILFGSIFIFFIIRKY